MKGKIEILKWNLRKRTVNKVKLKILWKRQKYQRKYKYVRIAKRGKTPAKYIKTNDNYENTRKTKSKYGTANKILKTADEEARN